MLCELFYGITSFIMSSAPQLPSSSLTNRIAITFILLIWLCTASAICPLDCFCRLDDRGRRKTSCLQGGMIGPLPIATIDKDTQVLVIKSTISNPNWLLLGAVFQTFTALQELHITDSNIPEIAKHAFWGVKGLEVLNLAANNITTVHDHNFRGLVHLRELDLSDNKIEQLHIGGFKYLTELKVLCLARNLLGELEARVFERLGKLQRLNLSGNRLKELYPEVFMDIQELRIFECRNCGLRSINTQIYHLLSHLTTLDLGDNDFFYLTNDEFYDLRKLKHLWLDGNHLPVVLEKTFVMQKELETLFLARNRLAKITNTAFINVTTLTELDISQNKLYRIEPAIFHPIADSLQRLDISGNNLSPTELKYSLQSLSNLRFLGLSRLNLTEVPVTLLMYYEKLQSLNLSGNLLDTLPTTTLFPSPKLHEIDLSKNRFLGLDENSLDRLGQLDYVYLEENPWSCDLCNIVPMMSKMNKSDGTRTFLSSSSLTCVSPKTLMHRPLISLKMSELLWCPGGHSDSDLYESNDLNFFRDYTKWLIILLTVIGVLLILSGSLVLLHTAVFKRQSANYYIEQDKRICAQPQETTAIFGQNGEISFKFPLDKKLSIATIDNDIKKVPNGQL